MDMFSWISFELDAIYGLQIHLILEQILGAI